MDQTQLLKGVLETAVLAVLRRGRTYGYDLVRQLRESGFEGVGDASVYGTLRRLFGGGFLTFPLDLLVYDGAGRLNPMPPPSLGFPTLAEDQEGTEDQGVVRTTVSNSQ